MKTTKFMSKPIAITFRVTLEAGYVGFSSRGGGEGVPTTCVGNKQKEGHSRLSVLVLVRWRVHIGKSVRGVQGKISCQG